VCIKKDLTLKKARYSAPRRHRKGVYRPATESCGVSVGKLIVTRENSGFGLHTLPDAVFVGLKESHNDVALDEPTSPQTYVAIGKGSWREERFSQRCLGCFRSLWHFSVDNCFVGVFRYRKELLLGPLLEKTQCFLGGHLA